MSRYCLRSNEKPNNATPRRNRNVTSESETSFNSSADLIAFSPEPQKKKSKPSVSFYSLPPGVIC